MCLSLFWLDTVGVGLSWPVEERTESSKLDEATRRGRVLFWSDDGYSGLPTVQKVTNAFAFIQRAQVSHCVGKVSPKLSRISLTYVLAQFEA